MGGDEGGACGDACGGWSGGGSVLVGGCRWSFVVAVWWAGGWSSVVAVLGVVAAVKAVGEEEAAPSTVAGGRRPGRASGGCRD